MGFMATLKGIPSTYNKDLQEDKEALFSTFDTINSMIVIVTKAIATVEVNPRKCVDALTPNMLATDMAYYLVRKGVRSQVSRNKYLTLNGSSKYNTR